MEIVNLRYISDVIHSFILTGLVMRKIIFSLFLSGVLFGGFATAAENDGTTAEPAEVGAVKKSDFLQCQRAMFNTADKDFDGRVSQDEINLFNDAQNRPKYLKAFRDLDGDSNGFLSMREIEAKHQEFAENKIVRHENIKSQLLTRYDKDGDGNITSRELESYFEKSAEKSIAATVKSAEADLKRKDSDGSGSVSLEEYLSSKTVAGIQKSRQAQLKGEYIRRDKNGDRLITRTESEAYILRLFEVLDKNKDDQLSASEQNSRAYKSAKALSLRSTFISYDLVRAPVGDRSNFGTSIVTVR